VWVFENVRIRCPMSSRALRHAQRHSLHTANLVLFRGEEEFLCGDRRLLRKRASSSAPIPGREYLTSTGLCKPFRLSIRRDDDQPFVGVADLRAVVDFARAHNLVSIIDNTFATPVNFRPPEMGFDLSLHSCTKYMNGHDNIAAGAIIGRSKWIETSNESFGGSLDPHAVFLLDRGLKTLGLRVRRQNESAMRIARFLESHSAVERVNYPGLESHLSTRERVSYSTASAGR
jgi:hypothetical protein